MATVHPSRMGLVPMEPAKDSGVFHGREGTNEASRGGGRGRYGERDRSHGYDRNAGSSHHGRDRDSGWGSRGDRGRNNERERSRDDRRGRDDDSHGSRSRSRGRDRSRDERRASPRGDSRGRRDEGDGRPYSRRHRTRSRSAGRDGPNARTDGREPAIRRLSPDYGDYRKRATPPPPGSGDRPNMYPERAPARGQWSGPSGGMDYLESRRIQREQTVIDVWPPSPKPPARDLSEERNVRSKKKSKRRRPSPPSDEESDSDDEAERRRKRKERKREKGRDKEDRHKHSLHRSHRDDPKSEDNGHSRRHKSRRDDSDSEEDRERRRHKSRRDDSDSEEEDRRRSKRSRSRRQGSDDDRRSRSRERRPVRSQSRMSEDEEWVEKPKASESGIAPSAEESSGPVVPAEQPSSATAAVKRADHSGNAQSMEDSDDDDEVGPQPVVKLSNTNKKFDERQYGGALLRGEGSAMAAFLQDGTETRIPRRGEIGLTSDEIASFESVGYVMSGSRHRRMNAVRMRKENQVISAEEKRGILKLQKEERERREAILRDEFKELVEEKLKGVPKGPAAPPSSGQ